MTDFDSPWKEALERYFPAFLEFFFPEAYREIRWEAGYEFLNKELQQVVRDAELGRQLADKVVKVWKTDSQEVWVLIHIEVQGQYDVGFAERMFTYYYRLHDRYRRPLASFAVLTDDRAEWRPQFHRQALWGCEATLHFPMVKLLDYCTREYELEVAVNPFAVMTLSHIKAQQTAGDVDQRYTWKLRLVKSLYQRGYERQDILDLFRFIDWLLTLPEAMEERLWDELQTYEEGEKMPYVTSVERIGIKKGMNLERQEGRQEEAVRVLRRLLTHRFGRLPEWVESKLSQASTDTLELWAERVLDAGTLDGVFREG